MHDWQSLSHVRWECKYHIVIIPKYRKRMLYGKVKKHVGEVIKEVCRQRGIELVEGHLMPDHIHMCVSIPPKHSVAFAIGFIKGKSAVRIHRQILGKKKVTGLHFWSRGYCVSTVGLNEETIRKYIREQDALEKRQGEFEFDS
jgi:REP-associated tyrosine transposase